jgi:DegV family protein with EDD domain
MWCTAYRLRARRRPYHARKRITRRFGPEKEPTLSRVAIFTDSASDMDPADAVASGIHVIPLLVSFGNETFKAGLDLSVAAFWERMVAPDAPFPTTAASSPGDFKQAYESAFAAGAEAIVSIHVAGTLSGTIKSAQIARDMLPDREIHIVDSQSASMAQGILAGIGVELAAADRPAAEIAETLESRAQDIVVYVALETLEYLKKGGRISGAQAAIGTLLSVKPIIKVKDGVVTTAERVRTRSKARGRLIELITEQPIERLAILHTTSADVDAFRDEMLRALPHLEPEAVTVDLVGASVGPHLGPGCVGAAILYKAGSAPA